MCTTKATAWLLMRLYAIRQNIVKKLSTRDIDRELISREVTIGKTR
jgi:hypothetical protein